MKTLVPALLFLAPAAAVAGPYDQPWVIITTDTARSADPNLRPVIVNRVDGDNVLQNRAIVAPGLRMVTVDLPPRKGFTVATQATFELNASPCMRYHVAAKLDNPTTQTWTPVIRSSETIVECLSKFKGGTTPR